MKAELNTIVFSAPSSTWAMRITADRRIEVNEDVDVSEAARTVLDALQYMLLAQRPWGKPWVSLTAEDRWEILYATEQDERVTVMQLVEAKLKEKNGV